MSRRHAAEKRKINQDPRYSSLLVAKLINNIMKDGKKSISESIVYGSMEVLASKTKKNALEVLTEALANIMPAVEVRSKRIGGSTYQIPSDVRDERKQTLAIRWLINAARNRSERTMIARLAGELLDAFENKGGAVKKKEDTHKMADANKAFAHYRV